jgi:hypothetical protein
VPTEYTREWVLDTEAHKRKKERNVNDRRRSAGWRVRECAQKVAKLADSDCPLVPPLPFYWVGTGRGITVIVTGWSSWKSSLVSEGIFTCLPFVAP